VPGPRLGGQLGGLLLPGRHRGRPGAHSACCSSASSAASATSRPDIDVDFEHERREEVIQYIYAKYGRERAAHDRRGRQLPAAQRACATSAARWASAEALIDRLAAARSHWWDGRSDPVTERLAPRPGSTRTARRCRLWTWLGGQLLGFPRHLSAARGRLCASTQRRARPAGAGGERRHARAHASSSGTRTTSTPWACSRSTCWRWACSAPSAAA